MSSTLPASQILYSDIYALKCGFSEVGRAKILQVVAPRNNVFRKTQQLKENKKSS